VLYPEQGVTKGALIAYYAAVSEWMVPRVVDRPLALVRCPEGRTRCFFQKHAGEDVPPEVGRVNVGEAKPYMRVVDQQSLIGLGQLGALELHTWGCHASDLERPDELVFDLDPHESVPWGEVTRAALELRERLRALGLECFVKTTGGKGLHVVVPVAPSAGWAEAKAFTKGVAEAMEADAPMRFTSRALKAKRVGRIFIDWLRNVRGATAVSAYSPRARQGAPVSMPVSWEDLEQVDPKSFTVLNVPTLLSQRADPWSGYANTAKQSFTLSGAAKRRSRTGARATKAP
jgi:bifunctional non-homologous end joining protein LigD